MKSATVSKMKKYGIRIAFKKDNFQFYRLKKKIKNYSAPYFVSEDSALFLCPKGNPNNRYPYAL